MLADPEASHEPQKRGNDREREGREDRPDPLPEKVSVRDHRIVFLTITKHSNALRGALRPGGCFVPQRSACVLDTVLGDQGLYRGGSMRLGAFVAEEG